MNSDVKMGSIFDLDQGSVIVYPPANDTVLTIFTLVCSTLGIALSAIALALLLLTAVLFVEWRQNYKNQLLIQFMFARFLYTGVRYFSDLMKALKLYDKTEILNNFDVMMVLYSEMALVSWMFFFSKQMYGSLGKVFDVERRSLWRVSLCAWLLPALLSTLLFCVFLIQSNRELFYYLSYLIFVKWPVLVANAVFLILSLKSVLNTNKTRTESNSRIVITIIMLIFAFCFQQAIIDIIFVLCLVLISTDDVLPRSLSIFLVIFNLLMLYHCAGATLFWLIGNLHTRTLWRTWCTKFTSKNKSAANRNSSK